MNKSVDLKEFSAVQRMAFRLARIRYPDVDASAISALARGLEDECRKWRDLAAAAADDA